MYFNIGLLLVWWGITFAVAGGGAYFGAYLKKKGENLATHEDIDKVLVEVRATTQATKEIEAKISNDMWDKQKRWEMRRDLMFETTKQLAAAKDKLFSLYQAFDLVLKSKTPDSQELLETKKKAATEFNEAMNALDTHAGLIDLVCGEKTKNTVFEACVFLRKCSAAIVNGQPQVFLNSGKALGLGLDACINAMRAEMGLQRTS
jgi:hypothetical protein